VLSAMGKVENESIFASSWRVVWDNGMGTRAHGHTWRPRGAVGTDRNRNLALGRIVRRRPGSHSVDAVSARQVRARHFDGGLGPT
jgi:hypothetical protein